MMKKCLSLIISFLILASCVTTTFADNSAVGTPINGWNGWNGNGYTDYSAQNGDFVSVSDGTA